MARPPVHPMACARALAVLATVVIFTVPAHVARAQEVQTVEVERIRPRKEKTPTLSFLKDNIDFIRSRFDLLRQKPGDKVGDAGDIDPRFLAYQEMLRDLMAARDSVSVAGDSLERQSLLASITELGKLENQLDLMDGLLAAQRARLGVLQDDFTGRQLTSLVVVLSGFPIDAAVSRVTITLEDGDTLSVPLSAEHMASLQHGGVVEVFHGFVEPREQVVEVAIAGDRWPAGNAGFVSLDPARDRITFLRLDLSRVRPDGGAASIEATTWLHETGLPLGDG
ncbi:MAG TPA: hypothetical protein VJY35_14975 [Candidatus Eisenbacteria bacterium]|nr:hypothetical protein [Candidatus Eisenbacteria bacterium]